jgi:hypothetical protein
MNNKKENYMSKQAKKVTKRTASKSTAKKPAAKKPQAKA